jgi:hypothetical protein
MAKFKNMEWFNDLKKRANESKDFQKAAKWFKGAIGWRIMDDAYSFTISQGQIKSIEPGLKDTVFNVVGDMEEWDELMTKGTINRLFRQNRIRLEGNKVEAMRYWKILWYLTEIAREVK